MCMQGDPGSLDAGWSWFMWMQGDPGSCGCRVILDHVDAGWSWITRCRVVQGIMTLISKLTTFHEGKRLCTRLEYNTVCMKQSVK